MKRVTQQQADIWWMIYHAAGRRVSGKDIAFALGTDRKTIAVQVHNLRKAGFPIASKSAQGGGYWTNHQPNDGPHL